MLRNVTEKRKEKRRQKERHSSWDIHRQIGTGHPQGEGTIPWLVFRVWVLGDYYSWHPRGTFRSAVKLNIHRLQLHPLSSLCPSAGVSPLARSALFQMLCSYSRWSWSWGWGAGIGQADSCRHIDMATLKFNCIVSNPSDTAPAPACSIATTKRRPASPSM